MRLLGQAKRSFYASIISLISALNNICIFQKQKLKDMWDFSLQEYLVLRLRVRGLLFCPRQDNMS